MALHENFRSLTVTVLHENFRSLTVTVLHENFRSLTVTVRFTARLHAIAVTKDPATALCG